MNTFTFETAMEALDSVAECYDEFLDVCEDMKEGASTCRENGLLLKDEPYAEEGNIYTYTDVCDGDKCKNMIQKLDDTIKQYDPVFDKLGKDISDLEIKYRVSVSSYCLYNKNPDITSAIKKFIDVHEKYKASKQREVDDYAAIINCLQEQYDLLADKPIENKKPKDNDRDERG